MRYLKKFKIFENLKDIHDICKEYRITNYTINDDLSIDVNGDVDLDLQRLAKLPLKFRNVGGHFYCFRNQLTSLEGAPQSVGGEFYCSDNRLTSLEGAPQSVGGNFYCEYNNLTSLEGSPKHVGGYFSCSNNQLTSLEGAPQSVGGDFYCYNNQLTSLEGAPQTVGGGFFCRNNPISIIWDLFEDYSKIELFNDYDPVREIDGKPALVIDRLNMFLEEIGKDPVKKVDGWINI
jgi:hypothetical protein